MRYEYLSNYNLHSFTVLSVGYSNEIDVTWSKCSRNLFIIHYCTKGTGYFNNRTIREGQGFIIPPNYFANYYADKNNPWSFFWIILSPSAYEDSKKIYMCDDDFVFNYNFSDYIAYLGEEITLNSPSGYDNVDAMIIYNLILNKQLKNNSKNFYSYDYAQYAKRYLEVYFYKPIKIKDICKILNVSHTYLYKEFTKRYGDSPKTFLTKIRIINAKNLIKNSVLNFSQIAQSVGFDNVLAFSGFFKKNTGLSPTEYKNKL